MVPAGSPPGSTGPPLGSHWVGPHSAPAEFHQAPPGPHQAPARPPKRPLGPHWVPIMPPLGHHQVTSKPLLSHHEPPLEPTRPPPGPLRSTRACMGLQRQWGNKGPMHGTATAMGQQRLRQHRPHAPGSHWAPLGLRWAHARSPRGPAGPSPSPPLPLCPHNASAADCPLSREHTKNQATKPKGQQRHDHATEAQGATKA